MINILNNLILIDFILLIYYTLLTINSKRIPQHFLKYIYSLSCQDLDKKGATALTYLLGVIRGNGLTNMIWLF